MLSLIRRGLSVAFPCRLSRVPVGRSWSAPQSASVSYSLPSACFCRSRPKISKQFQTSKEVRIEDDEGYFLTRVSMELNEQIHCLWLTLILATHALSSYLSLKRSFIPLRAFMALTNPTYSLNWMYASNTRSCSKLKVWIPLILDFIICLEKAITTFNAHCTIKGFVWTWCESKCQFEYYLYGSRRGMSSALISPKLDPKTLKWLIHQLQARNPEKANYIHHITW